ncbi:MAG: bis(5'-nucleosyl)-tetraphosphatase (symmetrical) YqeK [Alkalispirochaeta sp.]
MDISKNIDSIANAIETSLPRRVSPTRLDHIHRVTKMMLGLARRFDLSEEDARLAGLAHDMDRDLPRWKSFALLSDWRLNPTPVERWNPKMHHGWITAERLQRIYGISSPSIVTAVRHHTLGHPCLDELGLALLVADFCEPGRTYLTRTERESILQRPTLREMTAAVIDAGRDRFGPLEEPTVQLYARLQGA